MTTPPFSITPDILSLSAEIHSLLGEAKSLNVKKPPIKLRRENKIKTVHHSLAIEGNSLSEEQVSAVLEGKKVVGPKEHIVEVRNAIELYDRMPELDPLSEKDLLRAHRILMKNLVERAGRYRAGSVGIFKSGQVSRMSPPAKQVPRLMGDLFEFLLSDRKTPRLIVACIFHYELELIHPFEDGNGRMGRLWQQLLLMGTSPIFEFIHVESLIHANQKRYYKALELSDTKGDSADFITFSLEMLLRAIHEFTSVSVGGRPSVIDRLSSAEEEFQRAEFSRKDYIKIFKNISTATASRDLAHAVGEKNLVMRGVKAKAVYRFSKK